MVKRSFLPIIFGCAVLLWTGCSTKVSLESVTKAYYGGDPNQAFEMSSKGVAMDAEEDDSLGTDDLLWQIQTGIIGFDLKKTEALDYLERAESNLKKVELAGIMSGFFENFGAMLVNDTVISYKGYLYESAMVNYYKALYYLSNNNYQDARVEFNRASDRQRRIKEYYEKDISKAKSAQDKLFNSEENKAKDSLKEQTQEANKILSSYQNLSEFKSFNGYINPFIDYVSGIFFYINGDKGKATDFLKESYGVSQAKIIASDLELLEKNSASKYTWILIEDGQGPTKTSKDFSITLPIPTGDGGVNIMNASLALPEIQKGVEFAKNYVLKDGANQVAQSEFIASLNPLAYNEFQKQIPFVITRNILSSAIKLGIQVATSKIGGIGGFAATLGAAVYSKASTMADLRIATVMPNSFQVLRVENKEGKFVLVAGDRVITNIDFVSNCDKSDKKALCVAKNNMIYVRNAKHNIFTTTLISQ